MDIYNQLKVVVSCVHGRWTVN